MPLEYLESPLHALGGGFFFAGDNSFFIQSLLADSG